MGTIKAICVSPGKGTAKRPVDTAVLKEDWGIEGDAHAGTWHRQVSLLAKESIEAFRAKGADVLFGDFGENLVTEGVDLSGARVGMRITAGDAELVVTQIGKACHTACAIREKVGDCIMPREGIFARVTRGGTIRPGDAITLLPADPERPFTAAVITLSDRCFAGEREDKSGPEVARILTEKGYTVEETLLLPDGKERLMAELMRLADQRQIDVIFTTGGTGFAPRDLTPEATEAVCDRKAPGIAEAIRQYSLSITPHAMLSRQTSGIRKHTLIVNLPGSTKACREDLDFILGPLSHGLGLLRGEQLDP